MNLTMKKIPVLVLLLFISAGMYCQELSYKQFTVKDGLPGSIVYNTLQDRNGFIWFATNQGVSRFDGKTFTNFTKEDGLPDNEILKLYLDKYNNIWCISFIGIPAVFHNGIIKRFDSCKGVIAIAEDLLTDSIVLIAEIHSPEAFQTGFYRSHNAPGQWQFLPHLRDFNSTTEKYNRPIIRASSPPKNSFYFSYIDEKTFSLIIKNDTLLRRYTIYSHLNDGLPLPGAKISFLSLTENQKGVVFITADSLYYADFNHFRNVGALTRFNLVHQGNNINDVFCENDSTLWFCTRAQGLLRITNFLTPHPQVHSFLQNSFCTAIIKDQENGYWITTHGDGVYYLPNLSFYALPASPNFNSQNALCIRSVDNHTLYAGFADGHILKIDAAKVTTTTYAHWNIRNKNNRILDVWPLANNHLLVGSDKGLYMLTPSTTMQAIINMAMKGLYVHDTMVAVACNGGLLSLNNLGYHASYSYLGNGRITCVTGLGNDVYWGTLQGVYATPQHSIRFPKQTFPLLSGIINHVDIAPDSSLWVATQQGIAIVKNGAITRITKEQGLPANLCKQVTFDKQTAWVATAKGIARIDYYWDNGRFKSNIFNITEEDGLITNDVNQTALAGNFIWAATASGISCFSKNYTSHSVLHPMININSIKAGDRSIPVADTIHLNYPAGKLQFELSGISYRSGKQLYYEYRLNGLDTNWSSTTNSSVEFPALPFGIFTFEVRAVDRWGARSNQPERIVIINEAPFWKTNWFLAMTYVILAALLSIAFYTYYRRRQQKRELEYQLKKKVHDMEMMALRAQMNPHFIFNCLTSIQYHIIRADVRNANAYLHKFSTLIRRTLQYSTASTITLREEIKILELYLELEKLRLGDRMQYQINIASDLQQDDLVVPTMIVQPYAENAIKHGIAPLKDRQGILNITIKRTDDYIIFTVEDNGPGIYSNPPVEKITEAEDHTSMGTNITERRIDAINDIQKNKILLQIVDKQKAALGTTGTIIKISFPITAI